jgi:predicted nuclease of predicted toxin-antitoxin system
MKFVIDMNLSPRWEGVLEAAGFEAAHWSKLGSPRASDAEIMEWAAEHHCVILTVDLDFGAILAAMNRARPSVVQIRDGNATPEHLAHCIIAMLHQLREELEAGAIATIDGTRFRVSLLPLGREA